MNLLSQNEYIRKFLLTAVEYEYEGPVPCDELAKELKIELPDVFRGAKISNANIKQSGGKRITWSNIKHPFWAWFARILGFVERKSRCVLICWDGPMDGKLHCIHICVTCFDEWPGPGCIIHGSYN